MPNAIPAATVCPAEAGDVTRPCGKHPRLGAMRSPQTIIDQRSPRGGEHHARGLRDNYGLKMEQINETGLDELRLRQRCNYAQHRLVGKEHRSLGHRVDVAGEAERPKPGDEAAGKLAQAANSLEVFRGEGEGLKELHSLLEPGRHQEPAM